MSSEPVYDVFVDVHEPPEIVKSLSKRGLKVKQVKLNVGDIVFSGTKTGFERKTMQDFIGSLIPKMHGSRLYEQAFNMMQNFDTRVILLIGGKGDVKHGKYMPASLARTKATLYAKFGIPTISFYDNDEMAEFVYKTWDKQINKKPSNRPLPTVRRTAPLSERVENALAQSKKIGLKTAQKLLKEKGSIQNIANMDYSDMVSLIGEKPAEQLKKLLQKEITYG